MSAGNYDITIDQGSDFLMTLVVKDNGVERNLVGWLGRGKLKETFDTAVYYPFTIEGGTNSQYLQNDGTIIVKLPYSITEYHNDQASNKKLQAGNYVYDIEIYKTFDPNNPDDKVERIIQGKVTVSQEVTD